MRLLLALSAFSLVLGSCDSESPIAPASPAESSSPNQCREIARDLPEWRNFTPPTHAEGDRTVMPIVFSDGTTAELIYPPELDLASLGVSVLRTSGLIGDDTDSGRGVDIRYGVPPEDRKNRDQPSACYEGAHGQVEVWETGDKVVPQYMYVPLHSWTAAIFDGNVGNFLTEDQRETWATALTAEQHEDGWVIVRPENELRLGAQYHGDMKMELGDITKRALKLWPIQCHANAGQDPNDVDIQFGEVGGGQAFASWCDERGPMEVHVYADEAFIRNVAANLEIRNVQHAYDPDKYHVVP